MHGHYVPLLANDAGVCRGLKPARWVIVVPTFRSADTNMNHTEQLKALDDARWRIAVALTVAMMVLYFGFILLVAYAKPLLGRIVVPGLSLGILLGALVIIAAWVLIWIYVRWANTHYDAAIEALRGRT